MREKKKIAAGLVSDCFPGVSDMVIKMTYYHKAKNPVLMIRTVNISTSSYAYFTMQCMNKNCTNGGFELTPVINDMVKNHDITQKGTLVCCGDNDTISPDHASISYEISINYYKEP
jgi:hypothetical protein